MESPWFSKSYTFSNKTFNFKFRIPLEIHNPLKCHSKLFFFDVLSLIRADNCSSKITLDNWIFSFDSIPEILEELSKDNNIIFLCRENCQPLIDQILKTLPFEIYVLIVNIYDCDFLLNCLENLIFKYFGSIDNQEHHSIKFILDDCFFCGQTNDCPKFQHVLPTNLFPENIPFVPSENQELIVTVGQQGSGKSTFCQNLNQHNYKILNKEKRGYLKLLEQLLLEGHKVVFDATNPTKQNRKDLIDIAQKHNIPVRIVWLSESGLERNSKREDPVPIIALRKYTGSFERPTTNETGVTKVIRLN